MNNENNENIINTAVREGAHTAVKECEHSSPEIAPEASNDIDTIETIEPIEPIEPNTESNSQSQSNNEKPKELEIGSEIAIEKIIEIFPKTDEPIDKIRISDIGLYSITKKNEAFFITNLITKYFGESHIVITDSTACCGGNTISFLLHPQIEKVNSVEMNELHFEMLKNNIQLYKHHSKVELIKENYN